MTFTMLKILKKASGETVSAKSRDDVESTREATHGRPSIPTVARPGHVISKPLKAVVEYVDGLDPKGATPYAKAIANEQIKLPELCSFDILPFKNDATQGYLIEVHQGGGQLSHLKAIHELCEQNDGSIGFFEIAGKRVITVQVIEGRPDSLLLNEQKSAALLQMSPEELVEEKYVLLAAKRKMKPVIHANAHLIYIGLASMCIGIVSLLIAGGFYQSQFAAARYVRTLTPDAVPHLQWNRVARPAPGRYVTKLQFENGQWSQETLPFPAAETPPEPLEPGNLTPGNAP